MTNYATGHGAEKTAASYLQSLGYEIIELNWRTKYCEIDIVVQKQQIVYFVEVKYRQSANYGSPFEYITPKKLNQMKFAAEMWVANHDWPGDYQLSALSITGDDIDFLPDL